MLKYACQGFDGIEGMLTDRGYEIDAEMAKSISMSKTKSVKTKRKSLSLFDNRYHADLEIEDTLPDSSAVNIQKSRQHLKESAEPLFHQDGPVDHANFNVSNYKTSFTNRESGVDYKTKVI